MKTIVKPGKEAILIFFIILNLNFNAQINSLNRMYEVWNDQSAPNRGSNENGKSASFPYEFETTPGETYYVTDIPQKNQVTISADVENSKINFAVEDLKSFFTEQGIELLYCTLKNKT